MKKANLVARTTRFCYRIPPETESGGTVQRVWEISFRDPAQKILVDLDDGHIVGYEKPPRHKRARGRE